MDKLLTPIEQAKLLGVLKEPEQMKSDQKQNYMFYGMLLACSVILGGLLIHHFAEKNNEKQK